ncbi:MAG: hypothetical protein HY075_00175, partial [Deltaproteobacteria bacterium]|nr:hypothetical protein [Deltaproteobacteria bacterium]
RENQHHYDSWGHRLSLLEPGECGSEGAALALDGFDAARRWGHAFGGERRSSCSRSGLGPSVAPPRDAEI